MQNISAVRTGTVLQDQVKIIRAQSEWLNYVNDLIQYENISVLSYQSCHVTGKKAEQLMGGYNVLTMFHKVLDAVELGAVHVRLLELLVRARGYNPLDLS